MIKERRIQRGFQKKKKPSKKKNKERPTHTQEAKTTQPDGLNKNRSVVSLLKAEMKQLRERLLTVSKILSSTTDKASEMLLE